MGGVGAEPYTKTTFKSGVIVPIIPICNSIELLRKNDL